jgi:hypothetical protein
VRSLERWIPTSSRSALAAGAKAPLQGRACPCCLPRPTAPSLPRPLPPQHYKAHSGAVTQLAFHPTGSFLLTSSLDTSLRVWDLREGQLFYTLHGHEGATNAVAFSPAGDYFASAGARGLSHLCCLLCPPPRCSRHSARSPGSCALPGGACACPRRLPAFLRLPLQVRTSS